MIFRTSKNFLARMKVGMTFWGVRTHMGKGLVPVDGPNTVIRLYEADSPSNPGTTTPKIVYKDKSGRKQDWFLSARHDYRMITSTTQEEAQAYYDKNKPLEKTSRHLIRHLAKEKEYLDESDRLSVEFEREESKRRSEEHYRRYS